MRFSDKTYEGKTFQGVQAPAADLSKIEFTGCAFKGCDLSRARLAGALLQDCSFVGCNLSNAIVEATGFRQVSFKDSKLVGIAFNAVQPLLLHWSFEGCLIEMCDFSRLKMRGSLFLDCRIHRTDFVESDLQDSAFRGSDLEGSLFHKTGLERVDFTAARSFAIDPTSNRIKKAKFSSPEVLALLAPFEIVVKD